MHKKHLTQLFRRIDVEAPSGQLEDALAYALQLHAETFGEHI
jgi:hypothetical protein